MAIETLLFDLGKVLVDFDLLPMLERLAPHCAQPGQQLESLMRDTALLHRFESGQMTPKEYYEHVCQEVGLQMGMAEFWRAAESIFSRELLVSEDLLGILRDRYPLILVSNTNEIHARYIAENYRVFDYFACKILSYEVQSMKPDRRIYERAIEASGKRPDQLFFTDDRLENVEGAERLGIHAHQFRSEVELVRALRQAGVDVGNFVPRDALDCPT